MSFYDIKDHKKRDETIKQYLATMKRIKKRNMEDRLEKLGYHTEMDEMFKPILESNKEMTHDIIKDLVPIREELQTLNETIQNRQNRIQPSTPRKLPWLPMDTPPRPRSESEGAIERYGPTASTYLKKSFTEGGDTVTGVRYEGADMMIGDKKIEIRGSDLKIEDQTYKGTAGLWSLITERRPKGYTEEDLKNYKDIMIETNALYQNNDPTSRRAKSSKSYKWKNYLAPIWEEVNDKNGSGIVFLPKDIKGLWEKLKLLGAEYRAGNKTTRNELIAVLDELKRQGGITAEEYTNINSSVSQ